MDHARGRRARRSTFFEARGPHCQWQARRTFHTLPVSYVRVSFFALTGCISGGAHFADAAALMDDARFECERMKDGPGDFRFHPPNCNAGYAAAVRVRPFPSFFGALRLN